MPSGKEYLNDILEQLSDLEDIRYRRMMGEYILYYRGKVVGGIYDDRLLIKATSSARDFIQNPRYELPYEGAKEMLLIEKSEDKQFLIKLFQLIYKELPSPRKKKRKKDL